jgi:two-component system chemotaxis response regulator CheY
LRLLSGKVSAAPLVNVHDDAHQAGSLVAPSVDAINWRGRPGVFGTSAEGRVLMLRVLVVDDSLTTRGFVRSALEGETAVGEIEVVEAVSGFDALRLLPREAYDVVITDINMPNINGLELLQFIRKSERHRALPVVLISTQSSDRDRQRGLALGANAYLAKPFTVETLRSLVLDLLRGAPGEKPQNG